MHPTTPGLSLLLAATLATPAFAAWPHSPLTNLPVCTAAGDQATIVTVSDGAGGIIVAWQDNRGADIDLYAQHVLASGAVDPAWPADGRALCTAAGSQVSQAVASDGAGGAIVTWQDSRGADSDIYAQHVLASGAVDPAWPADGRVLCAATNFQLAPTLVSDGAGGAIVTWFDSRSGTSNDIYAQHVLASGTVDPAWPVDGRALCTAAGNQDTQAIGSDGAGGGIVTWQDSRGGGATDLYAQRVLASGVVDPAWPVDGVALCTAASYQSIPVIVSDGAGGAIVAWQDLRGGVDADIYAQRVRASGTVDPAWPADGRALCTATGNQRYPRLVSDGAGGAIVTWDDSRGATADIYAQHVFVHGAVDPAWPADGRALCTAAGDQYFPVIASDDAGGAIVSWYDGRNGTAAVYAQHVPTSGTVDPAWPADGRAVCAAGSSGLPSIVPDGAGGAVVIWEDYRSGTNADVYAQRVEAFGRLGDPEPAIASVADVPYDDGGHVKLSWTASYLDAAPTNGITNYEIWRSIPPGQAQARLRGGARLLAPEDLSPLGRGEALLATATGAQTIYWEYVASQPARRFAGYSYDLATPGDSVVAGIPVMQALVLAFSTDGISYWASAPMSGYSVDNLAPVAPAPFTGQYAGGTATLHWHPNTESDLGGYRLYRGHDAGFVPDEASLVAALPDTGYADAAGAPYVYKLTAIDVHGNESPVATLVPSGTTGVGDGGGASALAFEAPAPNPAAARTTLRFTLPRAGQARLAVYDLSGRLVRVLADGAHAAGAHVADWDLRDESGASVRAGLFFARLETRGRELRQRVVVAR